MAKIEALFGVGSIRFRTRLKRVLVVTCSTVVSIIKLKFNFNTTQSIPVLVNFSRDI